MTTEHASTNWPLQSFSLADFTNLGQRQSQALMDVQKECARMFQQANDDWRTRLSLERDMVAELTGELSAAKTLPDAAAAYQKWMVRHLDLMSTDGKKLLESSQTFMMTMTRLLPHDAGRDVGT